MSTTQIPPTNPSAPSPPSQRQGGGELYDSRYWESAYRELNEAPALLIQLQDDLTLARRREAFWISVVVHMVVVLLIINSQKLERFLPRRAVVVMNPNDLAHQKDLTYLELPPDEQKVSQRPKTNIISDKDRVATSKAPQLDRQELKKILDASRAGAPGAGAPSPQLPPQAQPQSAPPTQVAQNEPPAPSPPPPSQTPPKMALPTPSFNTNMSAGSAIAQAAQAAAANRGSTAGYAGDDGEFGLGQGRQGRAVGALDVLSDTMGVDFGPYLARVLHDVKLNWYNLIPESARAPIMKKGKVSIEFAITKNGSVAGMKLVGTSGDVALDRGAWGGITASNPFPPLPNEFGGKYLGLRFAFYYNPDKADLQ